MLTGDAISISELTLKRARLATELADVDARLGHANDGSLRPFKQSKPAVKLPRTCVACLGVVTDGAYLFTCSRSPDQILCGDCVSPALEAVASEGVLTDKGLCLSHMSSACSRTTGNGLIDYASRYISADLRTRLHQLLSHTAHKKCTVTRPLACMALCPSCGETASLDVPTTMFNTSAFIICRRCPDQPPWCLQCKRNVVGKFYGDTKPPKVGEHSFSFVNVMLTFTRLGLVPNGPHEHNTCATLTCLDVVINVVRAPDVKPAPAIASAPEVEFETGKPKPKPKRVPFPSLATEVFYAWAFSKHRPMPGFEKLFRKSNASVLVLPSDTELLATARHFSNPCSSDAKIMRSMSRRVLDVMFERALSQRCRQCGKAGVKDLSCTHIACCGKTWCYVCEDVVLKKKGHPCPLSLQRGGLDVVGDDLALGAAEAVEWFHVAKLAFYARTWLQAVGVAVGVATLLTHTLWKPFFVEHASKLFVTEAERRWFAAMCVNADVTRECCF